MKYKLLGNTGVRVSPLAIGTATLGVAPLEEDASRIIARALDAGINIFDCANSYGNQARFDRPTAPSADQRKSAEEILGKAIQGHRDEVFLCTKVMERVKPGPNGGGFDGGGLSRMHMMQQVDQSLRRLNTDHIDMYYAHHPDSSIPIEETLRTFEDLIHAGKIRYYAISTFSAWQTMEVLWKADKLGIQPPAAHQISYSLLNRGSERDVIPLAVKYGLSHTVFSPLAGGLLASLQVLEREFGGGARWGAPFSFTEDQVQVAQQFHQLAQETGYKPAHLALAWLTSRPSIASAIIGPENISELDENLEVLDLEVPQEVLDRVDEINKPQLRPF